MTSAQVVETSVTNNSSFQNYTHPDDHTIRTTDTPGFKPFTLLISVYYSLIYPYLNYTCTLWGNNYNAPLSQIVKLQNKAVRVINEIS